MQSNQNAENINIYAELHCYGGIEYNYVKAQSTLEIGIISYYNRINAQGDFIFLCASNCNTRKAACNVITKNTDLR